MLNLRAKIKKIRKNLKNIKNSGCIGMIEIKNKKAYFDYFVLEEIEAGIVLTGTEIKSIRKGSAALKDTYARIKNNEVYVINMYIAPYEEGNRFNHEERRERKLLLHKKEIKKLNVEIKENGYSLVPLKLYFKRCVLTQNILLPLRKT